MTTTTKRGTGPQGPAPLRAEQREWVRCLCPRCGSDCVSAAYHIGGEGYRIFWECLNAQAPPEERRCDYRVMFPFGGAPVVLGKAGELGR
jgi:hypothetical protein